MSTNEQTMATRTAEAMAENIEQQPVVTPPVDIFESDRELLLRADLPGAGKDDVALHFEKDRLTLEAKTPWFKYRREFVVSPGIEVDKTEAKVQHGVLEVHLPKSKALQTRQIKILGS